MCFSLDGSQSGPEFSRWPGGSKTRPAFIEGLGSRGIGPQFNGIGPQFNGIGPQFNGGESQSSNSYGATDLLGDNTPTADIGGTSSVASVSASASESDAISMTTGSIFEATGDSRSNSTPGFRRGCGGTRSSEAWIVRPAAGDAWALEIRPIATLGGS